MLQVLWNLVDEKGFAPVLCVSMSSGCRRIEVRCKRVGVTLLVELLLTRIVKKPRKGSGWSIITGQFFESHS